MLTFQIGEGGQEAERPAIVTRDEKEVKRRPGQEDLET